MKITRILPPAMNLLTQEIVDQLPMIGSGNQMLLARYFNPDGLEEAWILEGLVIESSLEFPSLAQYAANEGINFIELEYRVRVGVIDVLFAGVVTEGKGLHPAVYPLSELCNFRNGQGYAIEREIGWTPISIGDLLSGE